MTADELIEELERIASKHLAMRSLPLTPARIAEHAEYLAAWETAGRALDGLMTQKQLAWAIMGEGQTVEEWAQNIVELDDDTEYALNTLRNWTE